MRFFNYKILVIVLFSIKLNSQEIEHQAPTLQVGLDGISFSKGSLDPEVIARIIAEKQNEIKIKIIQNSFLKKIYGSGGTIYNYADNVIKGVVEEPDIDIRTRKIMESTVNLVFVYAFTDFYLKQVHKDPTLQANIEALAKVYKLDGLKKFEGGLRYRTLREDNIKIDTVLDNIKFEEGLSTSMDKNAENDRLYKFIALLIDMSSEVVKHNSKLTELGLMRISYSTNYDFLNMYKQLEKHNSFQKINKNIISNEIYQKAKIVKEDMESFIKKYTSYIGAIKSLIEAKTFKSNNIGASVLSVNNNISLDNTYLGFDNNLDNIIKDLTDSFKELSKAGSLARENYLKDLETAINKLTSTYSYLRKCKAILSNNGVSDIEKFLLVSDMVYTLITEVIPNIEYSLKFAPDLLNEKNNIESLITELNDFILEADILNNNGVLNSISADPEPFIKLVSKLYEFDKTKTFSEYTTLITLLDEIFESGKIKTALSTINTFVKDYTVIKETENGEEILEFNVESFLVKLDNIQSDKIRRFQFHFTVGMNTTSFINGSIDIGDNQQISNFSHFSEKVGLKFKIINRGDWLPKNPGETYGSFGYSYTKTSPPKEPLISNWHMLIYGSGILYNVINSSTNNEFDFPLVGFGTGVTFYNALDFNVSIGIPLLDSGGFQAMTDNAFLGFGFDIQIGEYLKEINKKRKINKRSKQLISNKL